MFGRAFGTSSDEEPNAFEVTPTPPHGDEHRRGVRISEQQRYSSVVSVLWRLKSCRRCQGDMVVDRDADGWYQSCLQCGYRVALADISAKTPATVNRTSPPKPGK